jgi:UDP-3-O-[3-hydroxymyristoyl] glucosamine N-acyltransferase
VAPEFAAEIPTALVSDNPYRDFARAGAFFVRKQGRFSGISAQAAIHPEAELGADCTVYPHAHVGAGTRLGEGCVLFPGVYVGEDCVLGKGCVLYPNAVVLAGVVMGDGCVLQAGAVLGTDGFGFAVMDGEMRKIPQIGTVHLADGVDVGANSCIDRAALGATSVGRDTKIDNLVQIGHNVTLGEKCLIISQVGIAGSTRVGDRVTMAGQAGIAGHLNIGDGVTIGPQAGVPQDIPAGTTGSGSPFMESKIFMRSMVLAPKVPDLFRRVRELEKELDELKTRLARLSEKDEA